MNEVGLDENSLFTNFESPSENEDAVSAEIKLLRKHLKKDKNPDKISNKTCDDVSQKKYINELEEQNSKLKAIVKRLLGPQSFTLNDASLADDDSEIDLIKKLDDNIQSKPFAIVLFMNNDISMVHRKEIDDVMKALSEKDVRQDVLLADKLQAQNSAIPVKAFAANCKGRRYNLPKRNDVEDPYVISAFQYYKSFFIDRMGAALLESLSGATDFWNIPTYEQIYLKALPIVEETLNIRVKQLRRCFNCDGDHVLNDCTEPKDMQRINMNRQQFSASKMNSSGYGQGNDDELDERYKHFKPGQISVGLEEALGISLKTQLPPYVYKMRILGYPPGWLKPADDGLKIYGPDGETLGDPDAEEGEIKGVKLPDVISYPGYNASIPEGVRDDCEKMGFPPYSPEDADLFIALKRAQALGFIESEPLAKRLKYEEVDMDIEDQSEENGAAPLIEVTNPRPPSPEKDGKGESEGSKNDKHAASRNKSNESLKDKVKPKGSKEIDETTYRNWFMHTPLTSVGITYVMYTPPPTCRCEVNLSDLPKNPVTDLDREPWKTASISWYDPLYGDLAAPTGTYDAIRTLLNDTKRVKRKPMT